MSLIANKFLNRFKFIVITFQLLFSFEKQAIATYPTDSSSDTAPLLLEGNLKKFAKQPDEIIQNTSSFLDNKSWGRLNVTSHRLYDLTQIERDQRYYLHLARKHYPFIPVHLNDSRLTDKFKGLGQAFEINDLIWSAVAPHMMNHSDAENYCKNLSARLPTEDEAEGLKKILYQFPIEANNPYCSEAGICNWFWSSSVTQFIDSRVVFSLLNKHNHNHNINKQASVRCVVPSS